MYKRKVFIHVMPSAAISKTYWAKRGKPTKASSSPSNAKGNTQNA